MDLPIVKFLDWVNLRIKTKSPGKSVLGVLDSIGKMDSNLFHGCDLIRQISEFYNLLYSDNDRGPANIVNAMVRAGFKSQDLESLMIGVALPLREALFSCKFSPSVEICSSEGFDLIGRKDLAALSIANTRSSNPSFRDIRNDLSEIVRLRFSCDSRIDQVDKIFNAAGEDIMDAEIDQNMPAEEVSIIQQSLLKKWSSKAFAVSLGRAMFLFESSNIVVTEIFDIPKLKTAARLPPVNSLIEISTSALPNLLDWPEFHVGVAAGLRIRQDCPDVDSSWITFNQPKGSDGKPEVDSKHAGFLLGLGLNGHLKKIDLADSLRYYLLPQHEMVSQGLLLGLGASFMATRDNKITQMLSIHVPSMLPSNSTEIITASNTRTAAIVAYGLVHLGSNSRHQIEKILNEFEQSHMQSLEPENENRQCFIVGCAFSLVHIFNLGVCRL
jgi:anaphase-promoting complex subunit 1